MYPHEAELQTCKLTTLFFAVNLPPNALHVVTALPAFPTQSLSYQDTLATISSDTTITAAMPEQTTSTEQLLTEPSTQAHDTSSPSSVPPSATAGPRPHAEGAKESTGVQNESSELNAEHSNVERLSSSAGSLGTTTGLGSPDKTKHVQITIGTSVLTADANNRFHIGSETLVPAGTPITISSTTYSLASATTAIVVDGTTSTLRRVIPGQSEVIDRSCEATTSNVASHGGLSVQTLSGSQVLVNGQTLAPNSTLTLGSGSVFTRVVMTTNQDGQTVLVSDSATEAPGTSCAGQCTKIKQSLHDSSGEGQSTTTGPDQLRSSATTGSASSYRALAGSTSISILACMVISILLIS